MLDQSKFQEIVENLLSMDDDPTIPRNVRIRIKKAISIMQNEQEKFDLKVDKSLQELGDIAEDPNLPQYTRMQIWTLVSQLESK